MYDNRTHANLKDFGDRQFVQDTTNWQVQHTLGAQEQPGEQLPVRACRRAGRSAWHSLPAVGRRFAAADGCLHRHPRRSARVPERRHSGIRQHVGGAINAYTAPATSRCGTSATPPRGSRGAHTSNFGFNYRRWWLQRDLATGFLGTPYSFNIGFTGNPVADFLSATTAASACSSRPRSACRVRPATRASSTSSTSRRTCRTTGR